MVVEALTRTVEVGLSPTHMKANKFARAWLIAVAVLASAPVGRADPGSACGIAADCEPDIPGYLSMLASAGIRSDYGQQRLVAIGQAICASIAGGKPSSAVATGIRSTNPGLTLLQGNAAVDAALIDLCPQLMLPDNMLPLE